MRGVVRLVALGALCACIGAATAWASTLRGNARANVIQGTPHADTIYGLGGNDTLYGGAGNDKLYGGSGNDLLVGGPGADLLNCGPGHDTVVADSRDTLVGCEVVRGYKKPPPPPPAPPPWQVGRYCGYTNNGGSICFDVTANPSQFTNAQYSASFDRSDCSPPATGSVNYTTSGSATINADGTFDFAIASGDEAGTEITGTIDTQGGASGNLHVHSMLESNGSGYTCTLNANWTAKKQ